MLDYLNKWGNSQRYSLSVSGGSKSVRYFVSGGYTRTKGLYSNVSRDRYNYSAKLDADLLPGLKLSVDLTGSVSENKNSSYTTIDAAYNFSPLQVLSFTDGRLASIDGSNPLINVFGNGGYNKVNSDFHTLNAVLRYNIPKVDGLSVYLKGTIDLNHQNTTQFSKPVALYLYDPETGTTSVDPNTVYPKAKIKLEDRHQTINNKLIEAGISYDHTFAQKHSVTALAIVNYQDYHNKYLTGRNDDLPGEYPEVMGSTSNGFLSGNEYYSERASLVGRATYGFDSRYFVEFSFRVDGSTRFAPENRWGFFPTASASWVISNEPFFRNISPDALSFAKIRGSYGILGDDGNASDYDYLRKYIFSVNGGYPIGGIFGPGILTESGSYPNPDLKWGKSKDFNFALDLGFWNNRFSITGEVFERRRSNMVIGAPAYLFPRLSELTVLCPISTSVKCVTVVGTSLLSISTPSVISNIMSMSTSRVQPMRSLTMATSRPICPISAEKARAIHQRPCMRLPDFSRATRRLPHGLSTRTVSVMPASLPATSSISTRTATVSSPAMTASMSRTHRSPTLTSV